MTKCISLQIYSGGSSEDGQSSSWRVNSNVVDCVNMITDMAVWGLIYFFIFEVRAVLDLLEASSHFVYYQKKIRTRRLFIAFLVLSTTMSLCFHLISALRMFGLDQSMSLVILGTFFRCIYLTLFSLIVLQWGNLANKIINKKREDQANKSNEKDFSNDQLLLILWIFFLSSILCLHHLNLVICGIIEMYVDSDNFKFYFCLCLYPLDSLVSFLTTTSLIYLFSYQASRIQAQDRLKDS